MDLTIEHFRRIERADINLDKVALVAGVNEQGKTSLAQAAAALFTANPRVLGIKNAEAGEIINDGHESAVLELTYEGGQANINFPGVTYSCEGNQHAASPIVCGQVRLADMAKKDALTYLIGSLKTNPTKSDLVYAFEGNIKPEVIEKIWVQIERDGWDITSKHFAEKATERKGEWKAITGEQWGNKKAAEWMPAGWEDRLGSSQREELVSTVATFKNLLEEAIKAEGAEEHDTELLKEKVAKLPEISEKNKEIKVTIETRKKELESALAERALLPESAAMLAGIPCPHCGKGIVPQRTGTGVTEYLQAPTDKLDAKRQKEVGMQIAGLEGAISRLKGEIPNLEAEQKRLSHSGKEAHEAKRKLDFRASQEEMRPKGESQVAAIREQIDAAERALAAFDKFHAAYTAHGKILTNLSLSEQLAPNGLRQVKLSEALHSFNESILGPISALIGSEPVSLSDDPEIFVGNRRYQFLSESAKFRANVALQAAFAKVEQAPIIIVDGADIVIGKEKRGGLLKLLTSEGMPPALITFSMSDPAKVPISKNGNWKSYWIENGNTKELSQ